MSIIKNETVHVLQMECDGNSGPLGCCVSISATSQDIAKCMILIRDAGWIWNEREAFCPLCVKRAHHALMAPEEHHAETAGN